MPRPAISRVWGFLAFILLVLLEQFVRGAYGDTEAFRLWGAALLLVSVGLSRLNSIPVYFGPKQVGFLEGWRKLYVLVPSYMIAVLVCAFPHQVACAVNLRGYVCG